MQKVIQFIREQWGGIVNAVLLAALGVVMPTAVGYYSAFGWQVTYLMILAAAVLGWMLVERIKNLWNYDPGPDAKIRKWADEMGQTIKKELKPENISKDAVFAFHILNENTRTNMTIIQKRNNDGCLIIQTPVLLDNEINKAFNALPPKSRLGLLGDVKVELLKRDIGYVIQDSPSGQLIAPPLLRGLCQYSRTLTSPEFFEACHIVGRSAAMVNQMIINRINEESVAAPRLRPPTSGEPPQIDGASPPASSLPDSGHGS